MSAAPDPPHACIYAQCTEHAAAATYLHVPLLLQLVMTGCSTALLTMVSICMLCAYVCTWTCAAALHVHTCICIYICTYIYMYNTYVYIYVYVYMYMCTYACAVFACTSTCAGVVLLQLHVCLRMHGCTAVCTCRCKAVLLLMYCCCSSAQPCPRSTSAHAWTTSRCANSFKPLCHGQHLALACRRAGRPSPTLHRARGSGNDT